MVKQVFGGIFVHYICLQRTAHAVSSLVRTFSRPIVDNLDISRKHLTPHLHEQGKLFHRLRCLAFNFKKMTENALQI